MAFRRCDDTVIMCCLEEGLEMCNLLIIELIVIVLVLYLISTPFFEYKEEVYQIHQKLFVLSK